MPSKSAMKAAKERAAKQSSSSTSSADPLFPAARRNYRIGGDVRNFKTDLGRYVKWPRYVRLQRQRKILQQRLKVPPSINQFSNTLDKNQAKKLEDLLMKYQPETKAAKAQRLADAAAAAEAGEEAKTDSPPPVVKFGLKHVTTLIEQKKAKLVVIAHDVDPIELVVWLPALCRKMDVPYVIVKSKARLGKIVHKKKACVLALTMFERSDKAEIDRIIENARQQFNDNPNAIKAWGGGQMGRKTVKRLELRAKALEAEAAKRMGL